MKFAIRMILQLALLASAPAWAAEWVQLPINGNDQYFYDNSKLVFHGDEVTYWKKVQFKTPQPHKGSEVASGVLRERINCAEHSAKLLSYLYYSPAGETVEYNAQDESAPVPIIPDTVGDVFDRTLCPIVWRKQEEARIKGEQKTEAELKEIAPKAKDEDKRATTPKAAPTRSTGSSIPAAGAPKISNPVVPKLPNVRLPAEKTTPPIPEPQILEQLY